MGARKANGSCPALALVVLLALAVSGSGVAAAKVDPLTADEAQAKAEAMLFTAADLGQTGTEDLPPGDSFAALAAAIPGCERAAERLSGGGERGAGGAGQVFAGTFSYPVIVDIAIFPKVAAARRHMEAAHKPRYRDCTSKAFEAAANAFLAPLGATMTMSPLAEELDVRARDDLVSDGYAITEGGTAEGGRFTIYAYELGRGRAVATVFLPGDIGAIDQQRLLKLLSKRMATA